MGIPLSPVAPLSSSFVEGVCTSSPPRLPRFVVPCAHPSPRVLSGRFASECTADRGGEGDGRRGKGGWGGICPTTTQCCRLRGPSEVVPVSSSVPTSSSVRGDGVRSGFTPLPVTSSTINDGAPNSTASSWGRMSGWGGRFPNPQLCLTLLGFFF